MLEAVFWDECGSIQVVRYNPADIDVSYLIDIYSEWHYKYSQEPYVPSTVEPYDYD